MHPSRAAGAGDPGKSPVRGQVPARLGVKPVPRVRAGRAPPSPNPTAHLAGDGEDIRHAPLSLPTRALIAAGTGAAALALPLFGATQASAATTTAATASTTAVTTTATTAGYADNLDGWIQQSLAVMAQNGIPGSYEGIHRNIMRESSGNPLAVNNWDSNAAKGTPSKGLLQIIDPTFLAYHVPGTSLDPFDPVANITASCNYAAARYGSIDNVFGAY